MKKKAKLSDKSMQPLSKLIPRREIGVKKGKVPKDIKAK
jgi:hypothetical protein